MWWNVKKKMCSKINTGKNYNKYFSAAHKRCLTLIVKWVDTRVIKMSFLLYI